MQDETTNLALLLIIVSMAIIAVCLLCGLIFWYKIVPRAPFITALDLDAAMKRHKKLVVFDVRPAAELRGRYGRIKNVRHVPREKLGKFLPEYYVEAANPQPPLIIIVASSVLEARMAVAKFKSAGFTDTRILKDGMKGWSEAELPLVRALADG